MNNINPASLAAVTVTVDVTHWRPTQRERLFQTIAEIEASPTLTSLPIRVASAVEPVADRTMGDTDAGGAGGAEEAGEPDATGWTLEAYTETMTQLLRRHGVQAHVINDAIKNGTGFLGRDAVYVLGGYPPERSLKGFTRPVNRIVQGLVDKDMLPEDAADLLEPVYDPDVTGYQRALGFQVPLEVVRLLQDHQERGDDASAS